MTVRLVSSAPNTDQEICYLPADEDRFLVGGSGNFSRPPITLRVSEEPTSETPTIDRLGGCDANEFYEGRLVKAPAMYAMGGRSSLTWMPYGRPCDWPAYWKPSRVKQCLADKWIVFIGDTTLDEIAASILNFVYFRFDKMRNSADADQCPKRKGDRARAWDTGDTGAGPRLTFVWSAHANVCRADDGLLALDDDAFWGNLSRLGVGTGHKRRPDVLVFNSGLHDLTRRAAPFSFAAYAYRLHAALGRVRGLAEQVLWKSTSTKLRHQSCGGASGTTAHTDMLNAVATRLARGLGLGIADQAAVNVALPQLTDGQHCKDSLACHIFASSILNFVCAP